MTTAVTKSSHITLFIHNIYIKTMEINFKRVHTGKDLSISTIVLLSGIGLFFLNKGLGILIAVCGVILLLICKEGYRKDGQGPVLTKKSEDLCKACKNSIVDFLGGKDVTPVIRKGNEGGSVRLDVFFNEAEGVAYAQLYDYCNYIYEPVTEVVELKGDKAAVLIGQL